MEFLKKLFKHTGIKIYFILTIIFIVLALPFVISGIWLTITSGHDVNQNTLRIVILIFGALFAVSAVIFSLTFAFKVHDLEQKQKHEENLKLENQNNN